MRPAAAPTPVGMIGTRGWLVGGRWSADVPGTKKTRGVGHPIAALASMCGLFPQEEYPYDYDL